MHSNKNGWLSISRLFQEAVTAEQKNLGGRVENLLSWLSETEARSDQAMAGKEETDSTVDQITQQLEYCKVNYATASQVQWLITIMFNTPEICPLA